MLSDLDNMDHSMKSILQLFTVSGVCAVMIDVVKPLQTKHNVSLYGTAPLLFANVICTICYFGSPRELHPNYDFLFSVNVPDIRVRQRFVSASLAPGFDYLYPHLIMVAVTLHERSVLTALDGATRKCSSA